jgi:hypothetical protein
VAHGESIRDLSERVRSLEASRNDGYARSLLTGLVDAPTLFPAAVPADVNTLAAPAEALPSIFSSLKQAKSTDDDAASADAAEGCIAPTSPMAPQTPPLPSRVHDAPQTPPRRPAGRHESLPSPPLARGAPQPLLARTPLPPNDAEVARDLSNELDDVAVTPAAPDTWVQWGAWGKRLAQDLQPPSSAAAGAIPSSPRPSQAKERAERSEPATPAAAITIKKFVRNEVALTPETPAGVTRQRPPMARYQPNLDSSRPDIPRSVAPLAWSPADA